jgi:hypothetical protein
MTDSFRAVVDWPTLDATRKKQATIMQEAKTKADLSHHRNRFSFVGRKALQFILFS